MVLTTYIVRIYKFKKNKPWSLVGVVEEVGVKGRKAFTNYDELWDILNSLNSSTSSPNGGRGKRFHGRKAVNEKGGDEEEIPQYV